MDPGEIPHRQKHVAGSAGAEPAPPTLLAQKIESYLADHPGAVLLEDGRVVFDMRTAHYSVGESHGRCLLQLWSDERNIVRTVVDVKERAQCLRLVTRRMGAAKPQSLELAPTSDRRTPTARDTARRNYLRLLERVLARHNIGAGEQTNGLVKTEPLLSCRALDFTEVLQQAAQPLMVHFNPTATDKRQTIGFLQ